MPFIIHLIKQAVLAPNAILTQYKTKGVWTTNTIIGRVGFDNLGEYVNGKEN